MKRAREHPARFRNLEFIGWGVVGRPQPGVIVSGPAGDSIDVTGYNESDYWDQGRFKGPDPYGIVPVYRDENGKQFPVAKVYPHLG